LLEQLVEFELGRFLLMNKGLNGYWTSYIIHLALKEELSNPLEKWFIYDCPGILATRERFKIFHKQLTHCLQEDSTIASIPCGLMDDLLLLDDKHLTRINYVGIDLDPHSLSLATANAHRVGKESCSCFLQKDAWDLNIHETYDVISSNGLNIYEPNPEKVTELYRGFFNALKKYGVLITSFLTPPPTLTDESTWINVNPDSIIKQKAIFSDILQVGWQSYQSEAAVREQLLRIGFSGIDIEYDSQGMFPTVIATK
jgi:ubiquinone/menaquinone biosynthesis C-methylase UbiE